MVLQLNAVEKNYRKNGQQVTALAGVDLTLEPGQFVAVRGSSGCGKSTLLLAAGGLLRPDQGDVQMEGQSLYALSPESRARLRAQKIGFVFQQFHLVPYLDVTANVLTATLGSEADGQMTERAEALIQRFGLESRQHHRPAELSTGERQRAALARALMNHPRLLLADEPTGNLDDENAQIVLGYLDDFARDGGAVVLATHDERTAAFAQQSYLLADGRLTFKSS